MGEAEMIEPQNVPTECNHQWFASEWELNSENQIPSTVHFQIAHYQLNKIKVTKVRCTQCLEEKNLTKE